MSKTFGGRRVLRDVDLRVMPGEIHGLMGQNGSGKSTLIKILAGYHHPDPGAELKMDGKRVHLPLGPGGGERVGFSFVHQDLALLDQGSVMENLRVGRYQSGLGWRVNWSAERRRTKQALARFDLDISPDASIESLNGVNRALVAILRALEQVADAPAGVLVLDEPTPYLPRDGIDRLFDAVRSVAKSGLGVIFVTHRLEEIFALADTVSVLRDGSLITTASTKGLSERELVRSILGFSVDDLYPSEHESSERVVASIKGLSSASVHDFSVDLRAGEVVGVTGLVGMGWETVPYLLFGASPATAGSMVVEEESLDLRGLHPRTAMAAGVALLPGDRLRAGAVPSASVLENMTLPTLGDYFMRGMLRLRRETSAVEAFIDDFEIVPKDSAAPMATLSGGNQQKVVVARWFARHPRVFIMHEPTQGVDVGARRGLFAKIRDIAETGVPILLASSEHQDLARLCDRVLVFRDGWVASELRGASLTEERLMEQCFVSKPRSTASA